MTESYHEVVCPEKSLLESHQWYGHTIGLATTAGYEKACFCVILAGVIALHVQHLFLPKKTYVIQSLRQLTMASPETAFSISDALPQTKRTGCKRGARLTTGVLLIVINFNTCSLQM